MAKTIVRGNPITLDAFYTDNEGNAVMPVDPQVSIVDTTGTTVVSLATPTNVALGHYQYVYLTAPDALLGAWAARWFGNIDGADVEDEDGFTVTLPGSISTGGSGEGLTCTPWATSDDAPASFLAYGIDLDEVDEAFQMAGDILYEITGRRWAGTCTDTIRPTAKWGGHTPGLRGRWWTGNGSAWGWCSCNRSPDYGCATIPQIKLPGHPVDPTSVVVTVNGVQLEPDQYRLDNHRYLVRLDGHGWPCCQNMKLADTEERTWSVAYSYAEAPDIGGVRSAVLLGMALFAELFPDSAAECKVPDRARSITRSGVQIDLGDANAMVTAGLTGIDTVDLWVASKNLGLERRPATVVVPGWSRLARRVGA